MKIIILDYESGETYIFDYHYDDIQDCLDTVNIESDLNLRESQINWMIMDKLKINIL